jgi:hypothetical protein
MGVIIAVAICIYYSQPSSQYISSWEGKRRQQIELFLHFAVGRTERRRRSHAACFNKFGWGTKVYVQKWLELSNGILHRFCLTRGQRSPVRISARVQRFIYQNQLEPFGGIYHRYNYNWLLWLCVNVFFSFVTEVVLFNFCMLQYRALLFHQHKTLVCLFWDIILTTLQMFFPKSEA